MGIQVRNCLTERQKQTLCANLRRDKYVVVSLDRSSTHHYAQPILLSETQDKSNPQE